MKRRQSRLKLGSTVFHDHRTWLWPMLPFPQRLEKIDKDTLFTVEHLDDRSEFDVYLRAYGFGDLKSYYGNGAILARSADLTT